MQREARISAREKNLTFDALVRAAERACTVDTGGETIGEMCLGLCR